MIASITGWKCRWPNITRAEHDFLGQLLGFRFHHHHRVGGAGDDEVELALDHLVELGLSTYSSLMKPTRAPPIGPMNGAPDSVSAAEAATMATMSGSFSRSCDSTVMMICVSQRQPSANSGRIGRSIRREVSVSFSVGPRFALEIAAGDAAGGVDIFRCS